jgi:hypothetical protein
VDRLFLRDHGTPRVHDRTPVVNANHDTVNDYSILALSLHFRSFRWLFHEIIPPKIAETGDLLRLARNLTNSKCKAKAVRNSEY